MHKSVKGQLYGRETSSEPALRKRKLCVLELLANGPVLSQLYIPEGGTSRGYMLSWPYGQAHGNQTHVAGFDQRGTATT